MTFRNRRYIRHPSSIPIECRVLDSDQRIRNPLQNISQGGLCFAARHRLDPGVEIRIRIPIRDPAFEVDGTVRWCRSAPDGYDVGVEFSDAGSAFAVRMVEQVCHIERYRADVLEREGRALTGEQAAEEWIKRYAEDFPD